MDQVKQALRYNHYSYQLKKYTVAGLLVFLKYHDFYNNQILIYDGKFTMK